MKKTVKESSMLDEQDVLRLFKNNFDEVELLPGSDRCDFWVKLPDSEDRGKVRALCRDIEQASSSRIWNNSFIKEYGSILVGFKDLTAEPEKLPERNTIGENQIIKDSEQDEMNENTKITLTIGQLKRLVKESSDRDDLTKFGRRDDATISVSNIKWDSDDDSLPTRVKLCVPYIGCISDDDGNTIEEKRTGYIEEVEHALNGHYNAWPEDFDFFVDDYGPCATLDEAKKESTLGIERNLAKEDVSPSQLFRNIMKIKNAVEKFNAFRQQALDKIGDEDSLYYETGSTLQSGPHYISKMYMDLDVDQVTLTWEEDEMLGWKTRRVSQENHANASDEFEVDNLLDSIKYMSGCVKKALKYYEKLNPDNEEEVLADLEKDEADEATELTVKEGTGEPSDELLISEFKAEWAANGFNDIDNHLYWMDCGSDSDKRKRWETLGRKLYGMSLQCDENARRVWKR